MSCNGNCCKEFPLPLSLEKIKRMFQEGKGTNGTYLEMKMIAKMLISLPKKPVFVNGKKYFWFTCKNFDKQTKKCMIYEKRPVMCRTFPDHDGQDQPCHKSIANGCDMVCGTKPHIAIKEFKIAHNL
jgi:Fe-S-cluster containining protein